METKYADLIKQLECVTEAYEAAFAAAKNMNSTIVDQPDIIGITGGLAYFGGEFERSRAIQLGQKKLTTAAIDCGSDFKMKDCDDFTRFECTIFGYRVFCLAPKGSTEEALLMVLLAAEEKANE